MTLTEPPLSAFPEPPMLRLDPGVLTLWRMNAGVGVLVLAALAAFWLFLLDRELLWALLVLPAGAAYAGVVPSRRYVCFGYRVGDEELRLRHGWLWKTESAVLHARVQHVDTRRGPLESMMGLATVVVFTAGTVGAMLSIPGLRVEDAEALRDRLLTLSGSDDAV